MFKRIDDITTYSGSHIGSRGTLSSIHNGQSDDFSENIPEADFEWEQGVRSAMITREASFGTRWHNDWQNWNEPDDYVTMLVTQLFGSQYERQELLEPPFGRR